MSKSKTRAAAQAEPVQAPERPERPQATLEPVVPETGKRMTGGKLALIIWGIPLLVLIAALVKRSLG
jgi:hypothetical protein